MSTLTELKQELILQKTAIESKGGSVKVANTNPSPSEITAGINTIIIPYLSSSTATEADVLEGKTFYSMDSTLKTGTLNFNEIINVFCPFLDTGDTMAFTFPEGVKTIQPYLFYKNPRKLTITFNSDLEEIGSNAFTEADVTLTNFHDLTKIKVLGIESYKQGNQHRQ